MNARVLVAEDSPMQAAVLRRALEGAGLTVTVTHDGEEALRRLGEDGADIVVSDVMMPKVNGYELCRRIKNDGDHSSVPVLLLTSLRDPVDVVRGLEAGADSFLTKPFDPDQLLGRIRSLLESRELQASGRFRIGVDVLFMGHRFAVTGERQQILDVLMSSFEDLVHANDRLRDREAELARAESELADQLQEVKANRERLDRALSFAQVAALEFDLGSREVLWSDNLEELLDIEGLDISIGSLLERVHPDDRAPLDEVLDGWAAALAEGQLDQVEPRTDAEFRIGTGRGRERCLHVTATISDPASGRVAAVISDVTERRAVQSEVRRQSRLLQAIVDASPDAIVLFGDDARIRFANPAVEELVGCAPDELIGRRPDELEPPGIDGDGKTAALERLLHGSETTLDERFPLHRRDGRVVVADFHARPVRGDDRQISGAVAVIRDITERAQLEEERRQAKEEAEAANLAKSEFLSRMSHELRTPLNAILGFAQLLEMGDGLSTEDAEGVDQILRSGRHLLRLIDEVLDISRIESGRMTISVEPVDVSEVVGESIDLVRSLADANDVSLIVEAPQEPLHVLADRGRLKQVLVNLLSNGVKYNRPGGRVTVSCSPADGDHVRVAVADTGPGIAHEDLDRLFTPFDRLGAERTSTEGTGLGLSLSRNLAEAMGGTIHVETSVGEGSVFTVQLPETDDQTGTAPSPERVGDDSRQPSTRGTVLYIEDNPSNLRLVERILEQRPGVELFTATDAESGLDLIGERPPDLVLLDLNLPGTQGTEVLRSLRDVPQTRSLPVVVLSADAAAQRVEELLAAGADGYLTKPLDVDQLLATVDSTLEQEDT